SGKVYVRFLNSSNEWTDFETDEESHTIVSDLNAYDLTNPIRDFKFKAVTHTPISNNFAQSNGFPEESGGVLITHRISSGYYAVYQEYIPTMGSGNMYKRYLNSDSEWLDFETEEEMRGYVTITNLNSHDLTSSFKDFEFQKISYTPISDPFASTNDFPEGVGGVLITYRISSGFYAVYQEYVTSMGSGKTYVRFLNNEEDWTDFKTEETGGEESRVVITDINAHSLIDEIGDFGYQTITHTPISNTFAETEEFPEEVGGTLVTYRISSSHYTNYQEWTPINGSKKTYKRYLDSDNNWMEFEDLE